MVKQPVPLMKPAAGRNCGKCTMCCKVMGITELKKPVGRWCPQCDVGVGCRIYEKRPEECRTFNCLWLMDDRFGDEWKPDKSKIVLTTGQDGNSIEIRCDPGVPAAWKGKSYHDEILQMAAAAAPHDGSVYVIVGERCTLVTADAEFPLGCVSQEQRIIKEMQGNRVVGVRVVSISEAEAMMKQ